MEKNNILEVNNLNVAFGDRTVVENLNFSLCRGETLGIVGESGSGKSVSTLSLMGLLPKTAKVSGQTGVEMEALTGVSVALLTVYDMCKAIDKRMEIGGIHLCKKTGGKSGTFIGDAAYEDKP